MTKSEPNLPKKNPGVYAHMTEYVQNLDPQDNSIMPENLDYKKMYHMDDMLNSDYREDLEAKILRPATAYPAVAYALGIIDIQKSDLDIKTINTYDTVIENQIALLQEHKTRDPKKVLEIGGGSGHISCTFAAMGIDVQSIEPLGNADKFFSLTNHLWFGDPNHNVDLINEPLHECLNLIDWKGIDTIVLVDTIEHVLEKHFIPFWNKVQTEFTGRFIITNVHHPITAGSGHTGVLMEHCRQIDDELYDTMSEGWHTIFRKGAHLVIEK